MHMADALISPLVGATLWAASSSAGACALRRLRIQFDERKIPLMGALGAFIFAAQMINFTIPATGSSGHLAGGMILAILLGPHAAFLVMASVLLVQALFFADGGLLALGCNVWNLGFYPAYVVYPFVYRPLAGGGKRAGAAFLAAVVGAVAALQLGALSVVVETVASGRSELPFGAFLLLMQPLHLAIGIVEGLVTAGIIVYIRGVRPDLLNGSVSVPSAAASPGKRLAVVFGSLAILLAGLGAWFSSPHPDGLEWSVLHITGGVPLPEWSDGLGGFLKEIQGRTAIMPDYAFKASSKAAQGTAWPAVDAETSMAGVTGAAIVLLLVVLAGWGIKTLRRGRGKT